MLGLCLGCAWAVLEARDCNFWSVLSEVCLLLLGMEHGKFFSALRATYVVSCIFRGKKQQFFSVFRATYVVCCIFRGKKQQIVSALRATYAVLVQCVAVLVQHVAVLVQCVALLV